MKGYVEHIDVEVVFDGQRVQGQLEQILLPDMLRLQGRPGAEALTAYAGMLPRYVKQLSPILSAAGQPVPIERICAVAYFSPLVALIMKQHLEAATSASSPLFADPSVGSSEGSASAKDAALSPD